MNGQKIIDGLKQAIAGDLTRVTIDGQTWVRSHLPEVVPGKEVDAVAALIAQPFIGEPWNRLRTEDKAAAREVAQAAIALIRTEQ